MTRLIALTERRLAHCEAAEPIVDIRIGAGEVDHELRTRGNERTFETVREFAQVHRVVRTVRQRDVEIASRFAPREIAVPVDRKRVACGIAAEYLCRAVALMHVGIDDQDARDPVPRDEHASCDRRIVEHAITCSCIRLRVMRSAGEVDGDAIVERGPARGERAARRPKRALDELARPGKAEQSLLFP